MPDDETPTHAEGEDGNFTFEIDNRGNLLVDGVVTEHAINPLRMQQPEGEAEEEQTAEAESETEKTEEPVQAATPAEPPPEPSDKRETVGKQKFKLKVYGEELEKEFDQNELVSTLQKGLAAEKRFQEVAAKEREIEPFQNIIKSARFKEWLDTEVQTGQLEAPAPPPKPEPEDIMGYRLRSRDPEFQTIREAMGEWAVTLPQYEASQLESNHRVFNQAYDRFKEYQAKNKPSSTLQKTVATKEVAEAVLATKELRKDAARTEKAGLHTDPDPNKPRQQKIAQLQKRSKQGDYAASVELARMLYAEELT